MTMRIERWLGFRVRNMQSGYQASDVRLSQRRPAGMAVKISMDIPDNMIAPHIEYVIAEPEELVGKIEIEVEEE